MYVVMQADEIPADLLEYFEVVPETVPMSNVWHLGPEPLREGGHYASFPTEIPRRALKAGSRPGDLVLDPFVGSGTTAVVARELGRECIGIDQKAEYLDAAILRLARTPVPLPLTPPLEVS